MEPYIIRIIQCSIGQYNLCSNEKSLSFVMGIYTKDSGCYSENNVKALLSYSGEADELDLFEDAWNNLPDVFAKCIKYANRVISSTDYMAQCLLFYKIYNSHYDILEQNTKEFRDKQLLREIQALQDQINSDMFTKPEYMSFGIDRLIKEYTNTLNYWKNKQLELKEDSQSFIDINNTITRYEQKINNLLAVLHPKSNQ